MRLNTLSNLLILIATVDLLVFVGMGLNRWFQSYRGQRDLECIFGSNEATRRTCW